MALCALIDYFLGINIDPKLIQGFSAGINATITNTIIGIGKSLKLKTVAKGIETMEQQQFVAHTGCDWAQGYFVGKPLPPEKLKPVLQKDFKKI